MAFSTHDMLGRIDRGLRGALPVATLFLAAVFEVLPLGIPSWGAVAPSLTLAVTYYWSVQRPDLIQPHWIFLIGILADILTGVPLGLGAVVLLVVRGLISTQRRYLGLSFLFFWGGCGLTVFAAALLEALLASVVFAQLLPLEPVLTASILTVAVFPPLAWTLSAVQKGLPPQIDGPIRRI